MKIVEGIREWIDSRDYGPLVAAHVAGVLTTELGLTEETQRYQTAWVGRPSTPTAR